MNIPDVVVSRDGKERGLTTGGSYPCRLEGCRGMRIGVRWPDGRITYPCTMGMKFSEDELEAKLVPP